MLVITPLPATSFLASACLARLYTRTCGEERKRDREERKHGQEGGREGGLGVAACTHSPMPAAGCSWLPKACAICGPCPLLPRRRPGPATHVLLGGNEEERLGGVEEHAHHAATVFAERVLAHALAQLVHQHRLREGGRRAREVAVASGRSRQRCRRHMQCCAGREAEPERHQPRRTARRQQRSPHPAGGLHRHLRVACGSCGCKVVTARVPGDVLDGKLVEHYRAALLAAALPSLPADQLPLLYAAAAGAAAGCARRQRLLSGRLLLFMPRPRGQQEQPLARGSCSAERWRMQACRLAAAGQAAALPSAAASALHMLLHQCQAPAKQRLPAAAGLWEKQVFGLGNPRGSRKTHLPAAAAAARGTTPRS